MNLVAVLTARLGGNVVLKVAELNRAHGRQVTVSQRANGSVRVKVQKNSPGIPGGRA